MTPNNSRPPWNWRHAVLALAVAAIILAALAEPRLAQDADYHRFADQRPVLGVPNGLDVVSNAPFLLVGLWGLALVFRRAAAFVDPWERWPYAALFAGAAATALGSTYYHLAPDTPRLMWDRLPMTFGFLGLLTAMLAERVSLRLARWLLAPLLVTGAASVLYWHWTETVGRGDLRFYLVVQFGSLLLVILLLALYPPRYSGGGYIAAALAAYAVAKLVERYDRPFFECTGLLSGHTMKHLAAAAGVALLAAMLGARRAVR